MWGSLLARTKPHRLKPMPHKSKKTPWEAIAPRGVL
jgi:hypothetical protein